MSKLSEYSKFDHLVIDDDDDDDDDENDEQVVGFTPPTTLPPSAATAPSATPTMRHVRKQPATTSTSTNLRFMAQYNGHTVYEWEQSLNEVILYIVSPLPPNRSKNQYHHHSKNAAATKKIICHISATHLQVGIQPPPMNHPSVNDTNNNNNNNPPSDLIHYYIDEDTYHPIDTKESTWCLEQDDVPTTRMNASQTTPSPPQAPPPDVITIYLQKVAKGLVWEAPLRGTPYTRTSGSTTSTATNTTTNTTTTTTTTGGLDPISLQEVQKSLLLERWQEENPGMDFRDATFNGSIPDPRTYMGGIGYS